MKKKLITLLLVAINSVALSAREYLIQTEWDQRNYSSLLPTFSDGTHVFAGCGTIAAAQVINYYGWLPQHQSSFKIDVEYALSNFPEGSTEVKFDKVWYWKGTHQCSGFPSTTDSLIQSIFYSEADLIDGNGTSTSPWALFGTFTNHFCYDVEAYVTDEYDDANEVVFCKIVSREEQKQIARKAIIDQHPVIVNGTMHSFILDGYDQETDQFHFNLGWGPGRNYWGDFSSWDNGKYSIYIPTPNKEKVAMPEIAVEDSIPLHILNLQTGEDHLGYLDNNMHFEFADGFAYSIPAGSYKMWIEFPDGSIIAPQLPVDKKSFADGQEGICAYSFSHNPALFYVDDRENYGFLLSATIYYNTRFGNFDMRYQEHLKEESICNLRFECNGKSYTLQDHDGSYYSVPVRVKAGSHLSWLAYLKDVPLGKTDQSHYQGSVEFVVGDNVLMIHPADTDPRNDFCAIFVDDSSVTFSSLLGSMSLFNSTNPFQFEIPTELYCFNGSQYDIYTGPISSLQKITPQYLYVGFYYDNAIGACMFIYNKMPDNYDIETGAVFNVDGETTVMPLAPGSIITAPADISKEGYSLLAWEPALNEGDTVPDGIVEYYASWVINQYQLYAVIDGDTISRGSVYYQDVIDYFDVPNVGDSVWVWDKLEYYMPARDYYITGSYVRPTYHVNYYVDDVLLEFHPAHQGDPIPPYEYIGTSPIEGYEYVWTSSDGVEYTVMPDHDITMIGTLVTSIETLASDRNPSAVYTLTGMKVSGTGVLPKGIYIINGKPRLVK